MSKYIPKPARELMTLLEGRGYACTYNHENKRVEVSNAGWEISLTLRYIKDRTPIISADIVSAEHTDYIEDMNDD